MRLPSRRRLAAASHGVVLPIVESQVGLEWQRRLCGKIVSVRSAMEGQAWIGGGGWNFAQDDGGSGWPTVRILSGLERLLPGNALAGR